MPQIGAGGLDSDGDNFDIYLPGGFQKQMREGARFETDICFLEENFYD